MGVEVVEELRVEPGRERLRVGAPAMVVRLGERAAGRRGDVLRARHLGARAPEGADPLVAPLALLLQHAVVGHLVQQVMLEGVLAASSTLAVATHDELLAQQRPAARRRAPASIAASAWSQNTWPTTAACCSAVRSRGASASSRACSTPVSVGRHARREQLVGQHAPALGVDLDHAVVDQHLDQLFHVERIALGAAR